MLSRFSKPILTRSHFLSPTTSNFRLFSVKNEKSITSPALQYINTLISDAIKQNPTITERQRTTYNLIEKIIIEEYRKAEWRNHQPSGLFRLIETLPRHLSIEKRLSLFCQDLEQHIAMPVMTSHPTRVISNDAIRRLYDITLAATTLDQTLGSNTQTTSLKNIIKINTQGLLEQSILQSPNLTPQQESDYALFIYQKILGSFPDFFEKLVNKFLETHGGNREEIAARLKPAVMASYRNIYSWVRGDADGNHNVTAATMAQTVPAQQIAIIEMYLNRINHISMLLETGVDSAFQAEATVKLHQLHLYLKRCINSINAGIWFDVASSHETVKRVVDSLNTMQISLLDEIQKEMSSIMHKRHLESSSDMRLDLLNAIQKELSSLTYLIEVAGFFGGIKEYVRQTTKINSDVFDNLLGILITHNDDMRQLIQNGTDITDGYRKLSRLDKIALHKRLSSNPDYFSTIKQHKSELMPVTIKELDRLLFILKHTDIFPFYICSDTEDKINFDEVQILLRLSSYLDGSLRIGQMHNYPINLLFLCETPKDLDNFITILGDILDDPYMRKRVVSSGFISYVSGPSDLGKTGGIGTHISLYRAQMIAEDALMKYKEKYPELSNVVLRVLHGYGGDMKRRIGAAHQQVHSTFQGRDAYDGLGAPGAFAYYLHQVVGYPSESKYRVNEFILLKNNHEKSFNALLYIEQKAIAAFQLFIEKSSSKDMLRTLTNGELEKKLNTSSRAGSKTSQTDITLVRAIGLVNLYLLTGINWDIFMSVVGWIDLPPHITAELPTIFEHSTVVKDIVYKVLFSIAVSDIPRAWKKIQPNHAVPSPEQIQVWNAEYVNPDISEKQLHHTLAYIDKCSYLVIASLVKFLPLSQQAQMNTYLHEQDLIGKPSHQIALELMDRIGGEFSTLARETRAALADFRQLATSIDEYESTLLDESLKNAALSCRGVNIAGGPKLIATLFSPLRAPKKEMNELSTFHLKNR